MTQDLTDLRDSDMFDSRDVLERIAELEAQDDPTPDETDELEALRAFSKEGAAATADWQYGEAFIRDSYFETYAQELAEDIGAIDREAGWPLYCIDWERAARDLQMDYTSVELDGVTFWARS